MIDYLSTAEIAEKWHISSRRVSTLCKNGQIPNVVREGIAWKIPADAEKPEDRRFASYSISLPLPVGVENFKEVASDCYYVDKTLMIEDILSMKTKVFLFTRPRRFGKTLNMSMLQTFFEKSGEDTSIYFKNKKIWNCSQKIRKEQGKYPVLFLSFKDLKYEKWDDTFEALKYLIFMEIRRHSDLFLCENLREFHRNYLDKMLNMEGSYVDYAFFLLQMTEILHTVYGEEAIVIIDEYDTPIRTGYINGYYQEIMSFMRQFLSAGLKGNEHLRFGFLTGIMRVAKESLFSGLNNLSIFSVIDERFSTYFGFTEDEVQLLAKHYHREEKLPEIKEWYDGYRFGNHEIYNPWSVINYFSNFCIPDTYWTDTSDNSEINLLLKSASEEDKESLRMLLGASYASVPIDFNVIYPNLSERNNSIFSFLFLAGYLKLEESKEEFARNYLHAVSIPNQEIRRVYSAEILEILPQVLPNFLPSAIMQSLLNKRPDALQRNLQDFLRYTISYNDATNESFYHGLMLGLSAMMTGYYFITSNREAGNGRYDLQFEPRDSAFPGILMEFKWTKDESAIEKLSKEAIIQVKEKDYVDELKRRGVSQIHIYGIAFSGKKVLIHVEEVEAKDR